MENRRKLAIANLCRGYLALQGFLSSAENKKVHNRIMKFRDKNKVFISEAQLDSVDFTYDDNAQEESDDEG